MKYKLLLFVSFLAVVLFSCEKEENRVYFEGGEAPVLTASSTDDMVLTDANKDQQAVSFSWTNPDYRFNTGVSSQDVTYTLEVDTLGANFTNPLKQEVVIPKALGVTYTVKELNTILTKLNLADNVPHDVQFRIKATLGTSAVPQYSNILDINITPYLDVAVPLPPSGELYMTGDGMPSGWTNSPPDDQKMTQLSPTEWEYVADFEPGFYYKFLSDRGAWQPQYGGSNPAGGELGFNMGLPGQSDPDAIPTPSEAGTYRVYLNFKTGRYTVEKQ